MTSEPVLCVYAGCVLQAAYRVVPLGKWVGMGEKLGCREHARVMVAAFVLMRDGAMVEGAEAHPLPVVRRPRPPAERRGGQKRRSLAERREAVTENRDAPEPPPAPEPTSPQDLR